MCAKILIIDDDERLVSIHSMILETEGFEVATARGGELGLSMVAEFKPEMILLDAMMPGFSGYETLEAIKANPDYSDIKVVMLTALSDDKMKEKAMNLGADDYIVKSQLNVVELVEKIKSITGI